VEVRAAAVMAGGGGDGGAQAQEGAGRAMGEREGEERVQEEGMVSAKGTVKKASERYGMASEKAS